MEKLGSRKNVDNLLLNLILTQMNLFYIDVESSVTIFPILLGFGACWHDVVDYGVTQYKGSKKG